jgi:hypothetical protein
VLWVRATDCSAVRPSGLQSLGFAWKSRSSLRSVGIPVKPAAVRGLLRNMPFGHKGFGREKLGRQSRDDTVDKSEVLLFDPVALAALCYAAQCHLLRFCAFSAEDEVL